MLRTAWVLAAGIGAIGPVAVHADEPRWPTAGWEAATPEDAGFDSGKLADALLQVPKVAPNTHGVFVTVNGRAILDVSFYPYSGQETHNLASVTKSVMTTLVAIAADQGKLSLDDPMLDFFDGRTVANLDDRKRRIKVRHLTGMTSGLACAGEHDEPTLHEMNASADWVQFTLDLPMAAEPGEVFSYCSPGMHLLSAIVQEATGRTTLDFARENLFGPLGIDRVDWPADPQGVTRGWGDLRLFPEDAAKIGYLWLNGGRWEDRQIVSESWVKASSQFQIGTGAYWSDDYGYGWWIDREQDLPHFQASGRGGQGIGVYPSLGIVAVTVAGGIDPATVLDLLGTAMVSPGQPLTGNPAGMTRLAEAKAAVTRPPPAQPFGALPDLAASVSGRIWRFAPNPMGLETLRVDFGKSSEAAFAMTFTGAEPPRQGLIGLDGVLRMFPAEDGMIAGMRGGWTTGEDFVAEYDGIAAIDAFDLSLHFEGDRVVMTAKDRTYEQAVVLEGRAD